MMGALLAPFLLLSLLSSQVMPGRASDGSFAFVLCPGGGPVPLPAPAPAGISGQEMPAHKMAGAHSHEMPADHDTPSSKDNCSWANAVHMESLLGTATLPLLDMTMGYLAQPVPPPTILAASRKTGLPPSTGPPLTA